MKNGKDVWIVVYFTCRLSILLLVCADARGMLRVTVELSTYLALDEDAQMCKPSLYFLDLPIYAVVSHAPRVFLWPHLTFCCILPGFDTHYSNCFPDIRSVMQNSGAGAWFLLADQCPYGRFNIFPHSVADMCIRRVHMEQP